MLQDSLGGNTKTVMVANVSPADYNFDETLSTLRYATRAKRIQNKPRINEDPKDAMIREFREKIEELKRKLEESGAGGMQLEPSGDGTMPAMSDTALQEMMEKNEQEKQRLLEEMKEKSESEKQELMKARERIEEERIKIEEELQKRRDELEREKQEREALEKRLQEMQTHVMRGGVNLIEAHQQQEEEIEKQRRELEARRREEANLKRELSEREEERLIMEGHYVNIQEEVEVKTKRLKKLWKKYQSAKSEASWATVSYRHP